MSHLFLSKVRMETHGQARTIASPPSARMALRSESSTYTQLLPAAADWRPSSVVLAPIS
jgi:hypothetical protein